MDEVERLAEHIKDGVVHESRYSRYAQTDEQEQLISDLEKTLVKLGKNVVGGTTIGKSPQTVVLDLTYQGSEIYVDASNPNRDREASVKINDVEVDPTDKEAVKAAIGGGSEVSEALSQDVKDKVLADFKSWSGGFSPQECEPEEIEDYINAAIDTSFDMDAVGAWLRAENKLGESKGK